MICPQCGTQNPNEARFCLHCGTALAVKCANCRADLPAGARFCMQCGHPVRSSTPADAARLSRLAAATPLPLARKVRAATDLAGEQRVVTILFADVVGSTALAQQVDAGTWMEIMNGAFDCITPAIYRYEGTIAQLVGDGLWAFFGAPVAHEDDPIRAVRAALDLLDAARDYAQEVRERYGLDFAMRACLNTGPVVMGSIGDDLKVEYTAMGGAVNLAARLKFSSEPMSVLITHNTHQFVASLFDTEELTSIKVKGIAEPVRVYQVHGAMAGLRRLRGLVGLHSPMVGRDAELSTLLALCDTVRAGLGRAVLVIGEPGLGKTRLITEWRAAVEAEPLDGVAPSLWAEGHSLSYGQGLAYHLLIGLLRSLAGIPEAADQQEARAAWLALSEDLFGEEMLEVYPYLGHLLSLDLQGEASDRVRTLDAQALQAKYLAAFRRLFQALASRRPLVLILEDLHWADPSSIELLTRLLPMVSSVPMLLCMVSRPDHDAPGWQLVTAAREVMGGSLTEVRLNALSEVDSRQLVANLLEIEALPENLRLLILKKAEGNPFFVEEVIRMLIDRGAIIPGDSGWTAGTAIGTVHIPDSLQGLLTARIDRLPDEAKHVLRLASVIGRQFPVKVLEYVIQRGLSE